MNSFGTLVGVALVATLFSGVAVAQEYPSRPIEMIVAFSPGGGTDIAARTIAPFIEEYLGGSIQVVNRAGAAGEVGFTALANAAPDGYTIGFINIPNLLTPPIERDTNYEASDIQAIGRIVYDPGAFAVLSEREFQNLDDLVAYAKENPNMLTYGSTGIGSDAHLSMLEFERMAGIKLRHVPFSGAADMRAAALGGHIDIGTMKISEAVDDVEAGTLRLLGQMADERFDMAADIPTFSEQGYDLSRGSHRGIGAPAGLPDDILSRLNEAVAAAVADPEFQAAALEQNLPLAYQDAKAFGGTISDLNATMEAMWAEIPWVQQ